MDSPARCPHCSAPRSIDDRGRCSVCGGWIGDASVHLASTVHANVAGPQTAADQPEFSSGAKLPDRFKLVKLIGAGGMGEVWLADDQSLQRPVAIKLLPRQLRLDPVAMENLRRETVRCQKLGHPHIVRVHDLHEHGDHAFVSMEYVDGRSLAVLRAEQPKGVFSWEAVRPWMRQLADALDFAHRERIIHRDVKPSNLILDSEGRLKLADFGVAATVSDTVNHVSAHHPTSGTVAFMSPQQMEGLLPRKSDDIYSLGATLYQLLTGKPPFYTGDIHYQLKHKAPVAVRERLKEFGIENPVSGSVDEGILKCLAKTPRDRPLSCAAALAEMEGTPFDVLDDRDAGNGFREEEAKPAIWQTVWNAYKPLFDGKLLRRRNAVGSATAIAAAIFGLILLHPALGSSLFLRSYDLTQIFLGGGEVSEVAIVTLDDMSHQVLKQPTTRPWDRSLHARLIDRLEKEGARQIVFDVIFDQPGPDPEADRKFAEAIASSGNVVLCGEVLHEVMDHQALMETLVSPLAEFSTNAGWGVANLPIDDDYGIRRHPFPYEQALPLAHAAHVRATGDRFTTAGLPATDRWLRYYGPPGTLPRLSYHRALEPAGTPAGFFRDKTVFVGAMQSTGFTGTGKDEYRSPVPFSGGGFFPGVEVQATVYLNLLRRDWLTRAGAVSTGLLVLLLGLIAGYVLAMLRPVAAICLAAVAVCALVGVVACAAVWAHVWSPWLVWLAQLGFALIAALAANSIRNNIHTRILERSLAVHVPPARVREILENPVRLEPGSEKRELTLLVAEVANFGRVADRMMADRLYARVNEYFDALVSIVHRHGGTVIRLSGDRVLAVWNAPEEQQGHQILAGRAALETVNRFQGRSGPGRGPAFRATIGLHFGAVAVGNFGNKERMEYTVLGTNVEVAAGIARLNEMLGTRVLVTGSVVGELDAEIMCRPLGWFGLKSVDRRVELFELLEGEDSRSGGEWVERFSDGLMYLRERNWDAAEREFTKVLERLPGDGPAQYFLTAVRGFRDHPPPEAWMGEIVTT